MRIAFLSMHTCPLAELGLNDTGGMNVYLRETARELGRRGICVDIYTRRHDPDEPMIVPLGENGRVLHLSAGREDEPKHALFDHLPEFSRNLHEFVETFDIDYDLVHSHYWLSGPVALELKQRRQIPAIASFHSLGKTQQLVRGNGSESKHRVQTEWQVVQGADRVIAGSPDERDQLQRLYQAQPETTHIVPGGFDREMFHPLDREQARRKLGLSGSKIVLYVGRITAVKGVDILLRAVGSMDEREGLQIVIIGGDPEGAEVTGLQRLAAELGIQHQLLFRGSVPQSTLPLYYSAADVCVVPSYYETFGLVAVEAMACGTPVVAARVGGLRATVADGKTGYLVPWHCPEPYAERLETLLGNDVLRASLGRAASESVEKLTWSFVADNLLEVYGQALGRPKHVLELVPCG